MRAMVMLTRGWQRILAMLRMMIALVSGIGAPHAAYDEAEAAESERATAVQEKQGTEIAPPSQSMPIGNRWLHAEPQSVHPLHPMDDGWMMGTPLVLREQ
jgi:hypothetical protein